MGCEPSGRHGVCLYCGHWVSPPGWAPSLRLSSLAPPCSGWVAVRSPAVETMFAGARETGSIARMSNHEISLWSSVAAGVGTLAVLAVEIALLVVVLTVVRRNRPRAVGLLLASAVISIAATVLQPVSYTLVPMAVERSGSDFEKLSLLFAVVGVGFALVRTLAGVLLVVGVARLAAPEVTPFPREYRSPSA
jgi:hypothetical protein